MQLSGAALMQIIRFALTPAVADLRQTQRPYGEMQVTDWEGGAGAGSLWAKPAAFIVPQEVRRYRYDIGLYKSDPLAVSRTAPDVRFLRDAASDRV